MYQRVADPCATGRRGTIHTRCLQTSAATLWAERHLQAGVTALQAVLQRERRKGDGCVCRQVGQDHALSLTLQPATDMAESDAQHKAVYADFDDEL